MKNILVPIGSSDNAKSTLQYAIDFAEAIDAKVFVFRAYKVLAKAGTMVNVDNIIAKETSLYLKAILNTVNTKNVDIKIIAAKGSVVDSMNDIDDEFGIDLVISGPRSNSIKEEVFIGNTAGSIIKQTHIPVLIVPENYTFVPFTTALTAFKSGVLRKKGMLEPLEFLKKKFDFKVNLLLVKTPYFTDEDGVLDKSLKAIQNNFTESENLTTFQGVLEHFQTHKPDLLCVFRRKRGFFQKLWESNTILRSQFYSNIPLLVVG